MMMTARHSIRVLRKLSASLVVGVVMMLSVAAAKAQQAFTTPEEAANTLAEAVKSGVRKDMLRVLGSGGVDIIESGDDVADIEARQRFTGAYVTKHSIE